MEGMGAIQRDKTEERMSMTMELQRQGIVFRDMGKGDVLMLVHGFGEAGDVWDLQVESLAEEFRLLIPDLAGSGSSPLPNEGEFTLEDHARCLLRILDELRVETCILVGHSMGGYIALAFAEMFPERLKAMGLFHSTALPDSDEKKNQRMRGIEFIERNGAGAFLREAIPNLYAESFRSSHAGQVREHVERSSLNLDARTLVSYYRAMMDRPDRTQVLKTLGKPVLMVMGEEDKTVLLQDVLPQCALPEECHMHVWAGVAHMGMREAPRKALETLADFTRDVNL
jgi:pimeloyl-ACP methyl ester carboxylesterase